VDSVRHIIGAARTGLTGLTRGRRVLYGMLGGAVLATAVVFAFWPQQHEMAVLFTGLSPVDAAAALEELARRDVPVELGGRGRTISVPAPARDRLRLDLLALGIGTKTQLVAASADEGTGTPAGLPPDRDRKGALEAELAKSVESLQGIQSARVHLVLPQAGARPGEGRETAASVLLRLDGHGRLGEDRIAGIQALVAAGVGELAPENVTVVDQDGSVLSAPLRDEDPGRGIQRLEMRKEVEGYLAEL